MLIGEQITKLNEFADMIGMLRSWPNAELKVFSSTRLIFETTWDTKQDICASRDTAKQKLCAEQAISGWLLDFQTERKQREVLQKALDAQASAQEASKDRHSNVDLYWTFADTSALTLESAAKFTFTNTDYLMQKMTSVTSGGTGPSLTVLEPSSILAHMNAQGVKFKDPSGMFAFSTVEAVMPPDETKLFMSSFADTPYWARKFYGINSRKFQVDLKLPVASDAGSLVSAATNFAHPMLQKLIALSKKVTEDQGELEFPGGEASNTQKQAAEDQAESDREFSSSLLVGIATTAQFLAADLSPIKAGTIISFSARRPLDVTKPIQLSASLKGYSAVNIGLPSLLESILGSFIPVGKITITRSSLIDMTGMYMLHRCLQGPLGEDGGSLVQLPSRGANITEHRDLGTDKDSQVRSSAHMSAAKADASQIKFTMAPKGNMHYIHAQ